MVAITPLLMRRHQTFAIVAIVALQMQNWGSARQATSYTPSGVGELPSKFLKAKNSLFVMVSQQRFFVCGADRLAPYPYPLCKNPKMR